MKKLFLLLLMTLSVNAIEKADFIKLLEIAEKTPVINFEKDNFSWDVYPPEVKQQFIVGLAAQKKLANLSVSEILPLVFNLIEEGYGKDKKVVVYYEKTGYQTNMFVESFYKQIRERGGLHFGYSAYGNVAFPWVKKTTDFNEYDIQYFWWIYCRKHLGEIWNTWYMCWEAENLREIPRKIVLEKLADDISGLGFYVFPYLCESIVSGDITLENVANIFKRMPCFFVKEEFTEWWLGNKNKFILPNVKDSGIVLPLIKTGVQAVSDRALREMTNWYDLAESYYAAPTEKYWYHYLPDEDEIGWDDIRKAIDKISVDEEEQK